MKKIILPLIFGLLISGQCFAACTGTLKESQTTASATLEVFSNIGGTSHGMGQSFTAGSSYSIGCVELKIGKTGSPTGNIALSIYADSGVNTPTGAALASSAPVDLSTFGSSAVVSFFLTSSTALTNGTKYDLALEFSGSGQVTDGSNRLDISTDNATNTYANGSGSGKNATDVFTFWVDDWYFATYTAVSNTKTLTLIGAGS